MTRVKQMASKSGEEKKPAEKKGVDKQAPAEKGDELKHDDKKSQLRQRAEERGEQIGGKGTMRKKKKVTHPSALSGDKNLQAALRKLSMSNIQDVDEVNFVKKDNSTVVSFKRDPKAKTSVQLNVRANLFIITGVTEIKKLSEMPPETAAQLNFQTLQSLLQQMRSRTAITGEPADGVTLTEVDDGIPDFHGDFDRFAMHDEKTRLEAISEHRPEEETNTDSNVPTTTSGVDEVD